MESMLKILKSGLAGVSLILVGMLCLGTVACGGEDEPPGEEEQQNDDDDNDGDDNDGDDNDGDDNDGDDNDGDDNDGDDNDGDDNDGEVEPTWAEAHQICAAAGKTENGSFGLLYCFGAQDPSGEKSQSGELEWQPGAFHVVSQ